MIETMRDNPRIFYASALAGAVMLGGVVAFSVVLPEGGEDAAAGTSAEGGSSASPIELPDELEGGLVAVDLGTLPEELSQTLGDTSDLTRQEEAISQGLQDTFGVPGAFRVYAAEDASAIAQVTALDKAPGLFTPDALPIDPGVLGVARAQSELVRIDGAVCSLDWGAEVPEGQPIDPAAAPRAIRCQLGDGDRTYELTAQGLTPDAGVAVLQDLADV